MSIVDRQELLLQPKNFQLDFGPGIAQAIPATLYFELLSKNLKVGELKGMECLEMDDKVPSEMGTKSNTSGKRVLPKQGGNHWSEGLLKAMKDPKLIILEDELTTTIKDLYPKSTYHYLVCCKENIPTLKSVTSQHINLLKHMHKVGETLAERHKENNFLMGYHSVPSMVRLHLHIISDDFDSPCLKTKKHWNSFTTEFFVPSEKVISELESSGKINHMDVAVAKKFIDQPLKCHKCDYKPKHIPDLKHHLKIHLK